MPSFDTRLRAHAPPPRSRWAPDGQRVRRVRRRAHARKGLSDLDAHGTAAQYQQALGQLARPHRLPVGPDACQPREFSSIGGITGEDPVAITIRSVSSCRSPTSTMPRPVTRADPRTTVTPSSSSARAFALVVVGHHVVAPGEDALRVELALGCLLDARCAERRRRAPRRSQQRLRGHAGPVLAFAGDQLVLDDRDVHPAGGKLTRAGLARGSRADDDRIVMLNGEHRRGNISRC